MSDSLNRFPGKAKTFKMPFWTWFICLLTLFAALIWIYAACHYNAAMRKKRADFEYSVLDKSQLAHLYKIYFDDRDSVVAIAARRSIATDSTDTTITARESTTTLSDNNSGKSDTIIHHQVLLYLQSEFDNKIDPVQLQEIRRYLYSCPPREAISYLSDKRIKIRSYFWLVGPQVYYEIMFWTLFGVISSLIFRMGNIYRNATSDPTKPSTMYDPTDVPAHIAKIFYAPICTLIIILGYNFFQQDTMIDVESSKGVIVFSFLAGFYSQRLMAFMDRIKDVILPNSSNSDLPDVNYAITKTLDIQLRVADDQVRDLFAQNNVSLSGACITLQSIATGEEFTAEKATPDPVTSFKAVNLKPGIYTLKAVWQNQIAGKDYRLLASRSITLYYPYETIEVELV